MSCLFYCSTVDVKLAFSYHVPRSIMKISTRKMKPQTTNPAIAQRFDALYSLHLLAPQSRTSRVSFTPSAHSGAVGLQLFVPRSILVTLHSPRRLPFSLKRNCYGIDGLVRPVHAGGESRRYQGRLP